MLRKILDLTVLTILIVMLVSACGKTKKAPTGTEATARIGPAVRAALVLPGPLGDRSFLDSANRGIEQARDKLGAEIKVIEGSFDAAEYEASMRAVAEAGYDIVISVGFRMVDATNTIASEFPDTKFAIVDNTVNQPNVASLLFREHEGSFLVGVVAASLSKKGTVGFVGGMDIPLIRRFQIGYEEGVHAVNPDMQVLVGYAGAFNDPTKGKELALSQYNNGADIIFAAAGKSGEGVLAASEETGLFSIGVDSNQDYIVPGHVVTSMMKKVDDAVFRIIKETAEGSFRGGAHSYGAAENMVGPSWIVEADGERTFRENGPQDMVDRMDNLIARLKEYAAKIKSGELSVTDAYQEQ
ncbi:MAG: BMP family ABC transporter substrate-binding protein [Spirochaetota bacterium]